MPYVKAQLSVPQIEDANGNPASGYTISSYIWDTSTPTPMYTSSAGAGSATSFTLNSLGQPQSAGGTAVDIFLDTDVTYKFIIRDAGNQPVGPTIGPINASDGTASTITFLQSGTGAVERDANAKMGEIVSVRDFGARGDGITDDTAEIQAALAAAASARLLFPAGSYKYNGSAISVTNSIVIEGDGPELSEITLTDTQTRNFLTFSGVDGVILRNIKIRGEYTSGTSYSGYTTLAFRNSSNILLDNVVIEDVYSTGLYLADVTNVHVRDCDIGALANAIGHNDDATGSSGIYVSNTKLRDFVVGGFQAESDDSSFVVQGVFLTDLEIIGRGKAISSYGFSFTKDQVTNASDFEKYKDIHVSNVRVSDVFQTSVVRGAQGFFCNNIRATGVVRGFELGQGNAVKDVYLTDIDISSDFSSNATGIVGYVGFGTVASNNIHIERIKITGVCTSTATIYMDVASFTLNGFELDGDGTAAGRAIQTLTSVSYADISGGNIHDYGSYGMLVNGTSTAKIRIHDNLIYGGSTTLANGIFISSTSSNIQVYDNDISDGITTKLTKSNSQHWNNVGYSPLFGSTTFNPPNILAAGYTTTSVTCTGAVAGDYAEVSFDNINSGIFITAEAGSNSVLVQFYNANAVASDMGSGTLRVTVTKA